MKIRTLATMLPLAAAMSFGSVIAADTSATGYVPDDDKGPEIGAAPYGTTVVETGKAMLRTLSTTSKATEYVPDDDQGPEIGAAPHGDEEAVLAKARKVTTPSANEFVPDDDAGPDIGAAPTQ